MVETAKKGPGRPRKQTNTTDTPDSNEAVEGQESVDSVEQEFTESLSEGAVETNDTNPLVDQVDRLMDLTKGFTPTFNRKQKLSVINLGTRAIPGQGMKFRQLVVEERPGTMAISLLEAFKSNHGGAEKRETLNSFEVPISDTEQYSRVLKRFFGHSPTKNLHQAKLLLDTLEQSVRN